MQEATLKAGELVFSPSVNNHHNRIDGDAYEDAYIVGDVHGCIRELEDLLAKIGIDRDTLFVFVGDLSEKDRTVQQSSLSCANTRTWLLFGVTTNRN